MKIDSVFLDTSFFIRLLRPNDPYHQYAQDYFRRFLANRTLLFSSTIVAAEYGVDGAMSDLPLRVVRFQAFDFTHAQKAATFAQAAYLARRKGAVVFGKRVLIPNDTKLLAQADVLEAQYVVTRDENMIKVVNFLRKEGLTQCQALDVAMPPQNFFAELF